MTNSKKKASSRLKRDTVILSVAIMWATFEITIGGGRTGVLTFIGGVFVSPIVMRIEERDKSGE